MIKKTTFTRRRATGVTLGTVLGVGIIPSMSRKLKATDQSAAPRPPGVKYTVSTHPVVPFHYAAEEGCALMIEETKKVNHNLGLINMANVTMRQNVQFMTPPNTCTPSLLVVINKFTEVKLNEPTGPFTATHRQRIERRYICLNGAVAVQYENETNSDDDPDGLLTNWERFKNENGILYPPYSTSPWALKGQNGEAGPGNPKVFPVIVGPPNAPAITPFGTINFGVVCCVL